MPGGTAAGGGPSSEPGFEEAGGGIGGPGTLTGTGELSEGCGGGLDERGGMGEGSGSGEGGGGGPGKDAGSGRSGRGGLGRGGGLGESGGLRERGGLGEGRRAPWMRAARICTDGDLDGKAPGVPPVRAISDDGGAGDG